MKMIGRAGKAFLVLIVGTTFLAAAGCGVSIFDAVDQVKVEKGNAESLIAASESNSFYDQLEDDDDLKEDVIQTLQDDDDSAESQALIAKIEFETTPAGDVVNNVFSSAMDLQDSEEEPDPGQLLSSIFTSDITEDEETFNDTIDGLLSMSDSLNDAGNLGYEGDDGADLAQMAVVATGVDMLLNLRDGDPDSDVTEADKDAFYEVVTSDDPAAAMEEFFAGGGGSDPFSDTTFDADGDGDVSIDEIFTGAGYGGSYELITGENGIDIDSLGL